MMQERVLSLHRHQEFGMHLKFRDMENLIIALTGFVAGVILGLFLHKAKHPKVQDSRGGANEAPKESNEAQTT